MSMYHITTKITTVCLVVMFYATMLMNRILNIDMVIIPLVQIYFNLPWSIIVEGQRLRLSHAVASLAWPDPFRAAAY